MATKCIVLGAQPSEEKKLKPIEFVKVINRDIGVSSSTNPIPAPKLYQNIELVSKGHYNAFYDTMFAYDADRAHGRTYLGHWNDGVAE